MKSMLSRTRRASNAFNKSLLLICRSSVLSTPSLSKGYLGYRLFSTGVDSISEEEKFLFDLQGFIVLRQVLSPEEVIKANEAIDAHSSCFKERLGELRNTKDDSPLSGDRSTPRQDMGGILAWKKPFSDPFRQILAHPKLVPYFHWLMGTGYRLDHSPLLIASNKGGEGFHLHGGPIHESGEFNPVLAYQFRHGMAYNPLLTASVQLSDHNEGDGGFCVISGSHKANFKTPDSITHGHMHKDLLHQPVTKAGDVVLFSEGTVHGALPWRAEHQRRIVLYRFAPPTHAYGRGYYPTWSEETMERMTVEQRAVMEPPYHKRMERPILSVDKQDGHEAVTASKTDRMKAKVKFDEEVFGKHF